MGSSGCALGQRSVFDVVTKYNEDESLDNVRLYAESIPESSARMGVVYRHRIATTMLYHTTSQLITAESTLDSLSPWRFGEATSIECLGVLP
jgi:hypothetical protein